MKEKVSGRGESDKMVRTTNGRWNESEKTYGLRVKGRQGEERQKEGEEEERRGGKKVGKEEGKTN